MTYARAAFATEGYSEGAGGRVALVVTGRITPAGTVTFAAYHRNAYWQLDENVGYFLTGIQSGAWQTDENVGYNFVPFQAGALQSDEDVLLLTAVLSRDGLLQADENVLVKAAPPVTSY